MWWYTVYILYFYFFSDQTYGSKYCRRRKFYGEFIVKLFWGCKPFPAGLKKSEIMMRGLHPSNAGELPVTRNMPFSTKTMPSKSHNRNMTGIYLGLVSTILALSSKKIYTENLCFGVESLGLPWQVQGIAAFLVKCLPVFHFFPQYWAEIYVVIISWTTRLQIR